MKCKLCDSTANKVLNKIEGYIKESFFDIYECSDCKASFSDPMEYDNLVYESIYKNSKIVPGYNRYYEYSLAVKNKNSPLTYLSKQESIYWSVKKVLDDEINKDIKVMEIGSGLGYTTYSINKYGFNCVGVDISNDAVKKAIDNYGDYYKQLDIFDLNKEMLNQFDLIIMTEVIEHINNPVEFLEATKKYLKDDGKILVTTPNKLFFSEEVVWNSDMPPVHFWSFTEKSMEEISKKIDMKIDFMDFTEYNKRGFTFRLKNLTREDNIVFYKNHNLTRLNRDGSVINFAQKNKRWLLILKKIIKSMISKKILYKILNYLRLDIVVYTKDKNETISVIFSQK